MNIDRKALIALPAVALLAGCATDGYLGDPDHAAFGEPNRQTYAAMIIDPDPHYDDALNTSAEKSAAATDRYRKDKVKKPERIGTQSAGSGGSGGGGGPQGS